MTQKGYKCLTVAIFIVFAFSAYANAGENIVFYHKIKQGEPVKERGLYCYPDLAISDRGNFYMSEFYTDKTVISKYDKNFQLIRSRTLNNNKYSLMMPHILSMPNDEILLQNLYKNEKYTNSPLNTTEPFANLSFIHLDKDLNIIASTHVKRIGFIWKNLSISQPYYYFLGNTIHLIRHPKVIDDYLLKINKNGEIQETIKMRTKITDQMMSENLEYNNPASYGDKYIVFTLKDLLAMNVKYEAFRERKVPVNFNIFVLDPKEKTITRMKNLTNEIMDYFVKNTANKQKKFIETPGICLTIRTWDTIYIPDKNRVIFDIYYTFYDDKKNEIVEQYFGWYNITSEKIKIVKRDKKYNDLFFFRGVIGDVCYFWSNRNYEVVGIKFDGF
ncbi:MAG: hypothetical protein A2W19_16285 [Spirochaetes bacterium RBG_16_49_21]|nr:MAG: hypothetical protein A2W19_16285 [Spirochaetes bacterium RBG_16_49_21]